MLARWPRTIRACHRVNITRCAIRRGCALHSAEALATSTGLQFSTTCGPPLAAATLLRLTKLTWQRCARYCAAARRSVLVETMHDCCGVEPRPCSLALASTAFDQFRQSRLATNGRVPAQCSATTWVTARGSEPAPFRRLSCCFNAWGRSLNCREQQRLGSIYKLPRQRTPRTT